MTSERWLFVLSQGNLCLAVGADLLHRIVNGQILVAVMVALIVTERSIMDDNRIIELLFERAENALDEVSHIKCR